MTEVPRDTTWGVVREQINEFLNQPVIVGPQGPPGPPGAPGAEGPAGPAGTTDYNDLTNKPTLGTAAAQDSTAFATAAQGVLADTAIQQENLAPVATSGAYGDLSGKPTLGSAAAQNVDAFATAAQGIKADDLSTAIALDVFFGNGTAAIDAAFAAGVKSLLITRQNTYNITADYTTPVGMAIMFERGAFMTVSPSATLYVRGLTFAQDDDFVWRGTGVVKGLVYATTGHFGMVNNYNAPVGTGVDEAPKLQRAVNSLTLSTLDDRVNKPRPTLKALTGQYLMSTPVVVEVDQHHSIEFLGSGTEIDGTRFWSTHAGVALKVIPGAVGEVSDFVFRDFCCVRVNGHLSSTNSGTGFQVGDVDKYLNGLGYRLVENVRCEYFNTNFNYTNSRNVLFRRCRGSQVQASRNNMVVRSRNNTFCGELFIEDFVGDFPPAGNDGPNLPNTFNIQIDAAGTMGIRQVVMRNVNCYRGYDSLYIQAQDGSSCGDISIEGSAFDGSNGPSEYVQMHIYAGTGAKVDGIRVLGSYFAGAFSAVKTRGPGEINGLMFLGNQFWYLGRFTFDMQAATSYGVEIIGNSFKNVAGGFDLTPVEETIFFSGAYRDVHIIGNTVTNNVALLQYLARFDGSGDHIYMSGNSGNWTTGDFIKNNTGLNYMMLSTKSGVTIGPNLLPTSSPGLGSGRIWRDAGAGNVLKVAP